MKNVKNLFGRKKQKEEPSVSYQDQRRYPKALPARELLIAEHRNKLITKTKRLFSVTESTWNDHYLYAIEQFAELVQLLPASEIHHHSEEGGLIDHTLEALHAGAIICQGYILPPNTAPEDISINADRWRFGAYIAILAHDIGKVVSDIEVVYRDGDSKFFKWNPWFGNLPIGCEYAYRYRSRGKNATLAKSLHEKAAMSLLPRLLTKEASTWLFEDIELISQLFSTVCHSTFGGQAISDIVRKADGASVSKNLGAATGVTTKHSSSTPLHEKVMVSLRKLIHDGELKRNKPGAAIWVTETDTWAVSKTVIDAVRVQLMGEGHKGIPQNATRIFEILREHDLIIANPYSDNASIWHGLVNFYPTNWTQKLTFLKFKNELIWPTTTPELFDGDIKAVDSKGDEILIENSLKSKVDLIKESEPESRAIGIESEKNIQSIIERDATSRKPEVLAGPEDIKETKSRIVEAPKSNQSIKKGKPIKESDLLKNEFIEWLVRGISKRKIRVNEPKAPVHILEDHIAIVTPAIFISFFDKNSLKKRIYENKAEGKKIYTLLQKELEELCIHQKSSGGQNISTLVISGERKNSNLKVYLLNRENFPSLSNFSSNKAMKIV